MLEFQNVSLSFANKSILKEVSFSLKKGEFTVLLGKNGAGKTTLLRTVFRLNKPERGLIRIGDQPVSSLSQEEIAKRLSYVPQSLPHVFDLRCDLFFTNISDRHIRDVIEDLDVKNFLNRNFHSLSGGERQRLLLASALSSMPELLLLDEVTQYADHDTTEFLGQYLRSYCAIHTVTVLAVSHDMTWVSKFSDNLLVLSDSKITCHSVAAIKSECLLREHIQKELHVS